MKLSRHSSSNWIAVVAIGLGMALGPGRAQAQRALGIDVSSYQGPSINWSEVKSDGVSFAWAKATQGTYYIDADFTINEANAKAAGVIIGAYHFADYNSDPGTSGADTEAAYFWNEAGSYVTSGGSYLSPMLDVELALTNNTGATVSAWVNEWCQDIANDGANYNGANVKPVVYTYTSFGSDYLNSSVTQWALDMASPNGESAQTGAPSSTTPWSTWVFWQYNTSTSVPGVPSTDCDQDVYNGSVSALTNYVINNILAIVTQPASVTVPPGTSTTFSVSASGAGTISYQWALNTTNIAGATSRQYTVTNAQFANLGGYTVKVTDSTGSIFSTAAFLAIQEPLTNAPGAIVAPSGLVDWWPADENTLDIIGSDNGTPQGGLTYVPGEQNMAFHFNGSTAVISNGTASLLSSSWTACMWVNCQFAPELPAVLMADNTAALVLQQHGTGLGGTQNAHVVGVTVSGVNYIFSPSYVVPTNTWTHLAFVGTSSGITLYTNGAVEGSMTNNFELPRGYIGATYSSSSSSYVNFMLGSLDNIMTYNVALSASQINAIYSAGSAGVISVPVITGVASTGSNQITLNLEGQTGKNYSIYSSTNLINWILIENDLPNTQGTNQFIDNNATNGQKYYWVSQLY